MLPEEYEKAMVSVEDILSRMDVVQQAEAIHRVYSKMDEPLRNYVIYRLTNPKAKQDKIKKVEKISLEAAKGLMPDNLYTVLSYAQAYGEKGIAIPLACELEENTFNRSFAMTYYTIKKLTEKNLVEKVPNERGRGYKLVITERGKQILQTGRQVGKIDDAFLKALENYISGNKNGSVKKGAAVTIEKAPLAAPAAEPLMLKPAQSPPFIYKKDGGLLEIRDNKGHYFYVIFERDDNRGPGFDIDYSLLKAVQRSEPSPEELQNMVSSVTWGNTAGKKAKEVVLPSRGLLAFNETISLSDDCFSMITNLESELFSGHSFESFSESSDMHSSYSVKLPGVGEVVIPAPKYLEMNIVNLIKKRKIKHEAEPDIQKVEIPNPANDAMKPKIISVIHDKRGLYLQYDGSSKGERCIYTNNKSGPQITPVGQRYYETMEAIEKGDAPKNTEELVNWGLVETAGEHPKMTEGGKRIFDELRNMRK